ncbi:hypothetical protein CQ052_03925 [Ochrobactrum sp. MYb15]|nr:hypothetical protein CQZ90_04965 [Ochrobactrum sp. MYb19]PRA62808.1 hypothetical protein CQ053_18350 [Ochrobactrum sp. MYb18]PRA76539.1 hypothetical protein CQ049_03925 [Brucella thiophenivorans]PRA93830.1 hypothetical protein CQ051_04965 [Ochrobactrum sp. MYb14]PRA98546.1 hypothetical protein CQ052_03925 [Ochrobactrum sp. MYb15]
MKSTAGMETELEINNGVQSHKEQDLGPLDLIKELKDLKDERNKLELSTRANTYSIITRTYGLALACKHDNDSWQDFCREEFFRSRKQKPKSHKPEEALRFFFAYLFDGKTTERQTLSKYNRALSAAFVENLSVKTVAEMLKNEGIEALAKKMPRRQQTANQKTVSRILFTINLPNTSIG